MKKRICCGTVQLRCHKMVILFFVPRIGNFLLEIGEKHYTFCHWSPKWTKKNPDAAAKFEVALSNGLVGDAFTRKYIF